MAARVDTEEQVIVFRTLKRRSANVFRAVPMPPDLANELEQHMHFVALSPEARLWAWSRGKAWLIVKRVMKNASIEGRHASPKGLRHAFGITAVTEGIPLNLVQRWLGHSRIESTAVYTNAIGREERAIAARM
ncbi:tyrosine-type recombinase/integrase [Hyphobacterium vulgare]